jgi:poly-gamma-glutamate synthesis protein (capsule biosynthesis protein)
MARRSSTVTVAVAILLGAVACTPAAARHPARGRPPQPASTTGSSSTGAAPTRPATSAQPAKPRTVTVLGSGDVLIHPPLWQQAAADARAAGHPGYDFSSIYQSIAADVRTADLATCELETPLAPPRGPFSGWPDFNAPPQVLTALKADGYTSCTTASNHTLDQGYAGVARTLTELDAAGLRHTGSARSAAEAATPLIETTRPGSRSRNSPTPSASTASRCPPASRGWPT